jgi:mRNA deadenylase 3'-5' endonuclease subunit Ccr4
MRMEPPPNAGRLPSGGGTKSTAMRRDTSSASPRDELRNHERRDGNDAEGENEISNDELPPLEFNIASFNVLAESYLTPRSHPGLPREYADVAFDKTRRRRLLVDTLERFCGPIPPYPSSRTSADDGAAHDDDDDYDDDEFVMSRRWDILALQELDLVEDDDHILPAFDSWGYKVIRTPNDKRRDCCAIAYDASKFILMNHDVIRFDDLSTLMTQRGGDGNGHGDGATPGRKYDDIDGERAKGKSSSSSATYGGDVKSRGRSNIPAHEMTGMVRSFLRRNCAIVAHLVSVHTGESIVVVSVHLYWHPGYEYVKLCQAKYLLDYVNEFAIMERGKMPTSAGSDGIPAVIICGDINSKPGSIVHRLFVEHHVDARTVAPWRYFWDRDSEEIYTEEEVDNDDGRTTAGRSDEEGRSDFGIPTGENYISVGNDSNKCSDDATPQHHDTNLEDSSATTTTSDTTPVTDEKDGTDGHVASAFPAGGYIMNGFSADFAAYCGILDANFEDKKDTVDVGRDIPEPTDAKVDPVGVVPDANHADLISTNRIQLPETAEIDINLSRIPDIDPPKLHHDDINVADDDSKASLATRRLMKHNTPQDYEHSTPPLPVKYMLDYTLNRFTR